MAVYTDEDGTPISTHSMLKTFRSCKRQTLYKQVDRLKPKSLGKPLKRGTWMHYLLEAHHNGGDWKAKHQELSYQFSELMDEEKDYYGDLPRECKAMMEGYIWHYKDDPWTVHDCEMMLEARFPDNSIYRGKIDALVENEFGLWIVDHKTHKRFPDFRFRLLDAQSALYLWAAREMGLKVQGFIWNYVRTVPPSVPVLLQDGSRISKKLGETDYRTYVKELQRLKREKGFRIRQEHLDYAEILKKDRYKPGEPQTSPFFRRTVLEKDDQFLDRVAAEAYRTAQEMHSYDFSERETVERNINSFTCSNFCSYTDICTADLMGANSTPIIKQNFKVEDPLSYYWDGTK